MANCLRNLLILNSEKNTWGWEKTLVKFLIKLSTCVWGCRAFVVIWCVFHFCQRWKIHFASESVKWIVSFYWTKCSLSCCNNPGLMEIWNVVAQILKVTVEIWRLLSPPSALSTGCRAVTHFTEGFCLNTHRWPLNWPFFSPSRESLFSTVLNSLVDWINHIIILKDH